MKIIKETDIDAAKLVAKHLELGGVIAIATDTIYGFGVDASNYEAVEKLYDLKKRDHKKAISILIKDIGRAKKIFNFCEMAQKIANKFLPGALTMVLPLLKTNINLAKNLNINSTNIGFRIIEREFITKIFNEFNGEIALTSANVSGQKVVNGVDELKENFFKSKVDLLVIDGGKLENNLASSVVKIIDNKIEILRHGAINAKEILEL